jgi:hypothetical protein
MARYELLFPSRYLGAADLGGKEVTVKIATIALGEIDGTEEIGGKTVDVKKQKAIVTLEGVPKPWLLNRTNGEALALIFGPETKDWKSKPVTLHAEMVKSFGEMVLALRVKGSPVLTEPMEKTVRRGRKKLQIKVVPTGAKEEPKP